MKKELKKQLIDQSAHFGGAFLLLAPLLIAPCALTAFLAGAGYGLVREVTEEGAPVTLAKVKAAVSGFNSKLDIACWGLGGLAAYLIFA